VEMKSEGASFQERFECEKQIRRKFENNEFVLEARYPDCVISFF